MMLDVTSRLIVIVGGGAVAVRKAKGVLAAGAQRLRVVAPTLHDGLPDTAECVADVYRPQYLDGAGLVFAATDDPAINDAVVQECRRRGLLVCRADADDENSGDFATPALLQQGSLAIMVATAGAPALAAHIRDGLAQRLDPRWAPMADAMRELRPLIRGAAGLDGGQRRRIFRDLAGDEALDVLGAGGPESLRRWLLQRYPQLRGTAGLASGQGSQG